MTKKYDPISGNNQVNLESAMLIRRFFNLESFYKKALLQNLEDIHALFINKIIKGEEYNVYEFLKNLEELIKNIKIAHNNIMGNDKSSEDFHIEVDFKDMLEKMKSFKDIISDKTELDRLYEDLRALKIRGKSHDIKIEESKLNSWNKVFDSKEYAMHENILWEKKLELMKIDASVDDGDELYNVKAKWNTLMDIGKHLSQEGRFDEKLAHKTLTNFIKENTSKDDKLKKILEESFDKFDKKLSDIVAEEIKSFKMND